MTCHVKKLLAPKIIDVSDSKGSFHGLELVVSVYYLYWSTDRLSYTLCQSFFCRNTRFLRRNNMPCPWCFKVQSMHQSEFYHIAKIGLFLFVYLFWAIMNTVKLGALVTRNVLSFANWWLSHQVLATIKAREIKK